jgi:hypothetical protein
MTPNEQLESKATQIRRELALGELSGAQIAKKVGTSRAYVYQIRIRGNPATLSQIQEDLREIKMMLRQLLP